MKNTKNRVAMALLFSGVVMAAEGSSVSLSQLAYQEGGMVENGHDQARLGMEALAGAAGHLDAESFDAAVSNAGTMASVLKQASHPLPSSILRAVNLDRVAHGLPSTDNLVVVRPSQEQVDRANREQAAKDAEKRVAGSGCFSDQTLYSALPGGYRKK